MPLYLDDTGGTPYYNAYFGAGTGPIYLDDVDCTLSASQLLECSSKPILTHNCDHHADAGVGCEGKIFQPENLAKHKHYTNGLAMHYNCSSMHGQLLLKADYRIIHHCCRTMHNWSSPINRR